MQTYLYPAHQSTTLSSAAIPSSIPLSLPNPTTPLVIDELETLGLRFLGFFRGCNLWRYGNQIATGSDLPEGYRISVIGPPKRFVAGASMAGSVSSVYIDVIEDVMTKVREEFINSGAGEGILAELQELWETKMMQCGIISPSIERPSIQKQISSITPVRDLNALPVEEYETPTAEMLFPPTPIQTPVPQTPFPQTPLPQTPIQTPLLGTEQMYNAPTGLSDYAPLNDVGTGCDVKSGRPSLYMSSPYPWVNQRPLGVDVNVAYVESREEIDRVDPLHPTTQDFFMMPPGKRKRDDYSSHLTSGGYMPQQDGAGDMTINFVLPKESQLSLAKLGSSMTPCVKSVKETKATPTLPQHDGVHDDYDNLRFQEVTNEVYRTPTPSEHVDLLATTPYVGTPKHTKIEAAEDDEPPLNEDDDEDDLDDFDQGEEEPNTHHLVLAQFDKVTRTKSRWKCTLKDGIMHINNRDFLFNKANGEFEF